MATTDLARTSAWHDAALPVSERVESLVSAMTLEEKIAQLYGVWVGAATDGEVTLAVSVKNIGPRPGTEIVRLYLHDPFASVVRPVQRLIGYARVDLEPGAETTISATVPADLAAFTRRDGTRIVESGDIVLGFGRSSSDIPIAHTVTLLGQTRTVDHTRALHATFTRA